MVNDERGLGFQNEEFHADDCDVGHDCTCGETARLMAWREENEMCMSCGAHDDGEVCAANRDAAMIDIYSGPEMISWL